MKRISKSILFVVFFIIVYLVLINTFSYFLSYSSSQENYNSNNVESSATQISFSDSISVLVVSSRWYGKIINDGNTETIYFFNFIPIIKQNGKFNFMIIHIFFVIILFISLILLNNKWGKNEKGNKIPVNFNR